MLSYLSRYSSGYLLAFHIIVLETSDLFLNHLGGEICGQSCISQVIGWILESWEIDLARTISHAISHPVWNLQVWWISIRSFDQCTAILTQVFNKLLLDILGWAVGAFQFPISQQFVTKVVSLVKVVAICSTHWLIQMDVDTMSIDGISFYPQPSLLPVLSQIFPDPQIMALPYLGRPRCHVMEVRGGGLFRLTYNSPILLLCTK